jgi:NAD(P)-dependent dehydrogenase (short-subunit alcohol dehydrogenase family)
MLPSTVLLSGGFEMPLPLEGKTAIVTGSSRGIGKQIALKLAQGGANVVVCGRSDDKGTDNLPGTIRETAAEIEKLERRALAVRVDLANDPDLHNLLDQTLKAFGKVDILVNNAVIVTRRQSFLDSDSGWLDASYRVNVRAPYVLMQSVGREIAKAGGGAIINISSGAGRMSQPPKGPITEAELDAMDPAYGISKAALDRMTVAYASELWAKNIGVVSISPGLVITERIQVAALRNNVAFDRAEPADVIARAVSFLAQNPLKYTGHILSAKDLVATENL